MRFYDDIVYDKEYNGLVLDDDEGEAPQHMLVQVNSVCSRLIDAEACEYQRPPISGAEQQLHIVHLHATQCPLPW